METPAQETQDPAGFEGWLRPLFSEALLWPVLAAALLALGALGAGVLLWAFSPDIVALLAVALAFAVSFAAVWREARARWRAGLRGLGVRAKFILAWWLAAVLLAALALATGLAAAPRGLAFGRGRAHVIPPTIPEPAGLFL